MSITSRQRNAHQPTQNSSNRPRLFGALSKLTPFSVTDFAKQAHEANKASKTVHQGTGKGFGGVTVWKRAARQRVEIA